ncbi:FHA domain-containing protein [Streptomyces sp. NPDC093085]|uniref:FHA domain-containing protein n=1 Tax=Streptomyces sp. NPDC093085 TaxID=3155068 RepID=UPI0034276D99
MSTYARTTPPSHPEPPSPPRRPSPSRNRNSPPPPSPDARALPAGHDSLARGASAPVRGTVFALALTGGMTLGPGEGRTVLFGRNRPEVHICLGEDDPQVSRHQGTLTHRGGQWLLSTVGRPPIRCPGGRLLVRDEEPLALGTGYTPLFVGGSRGREHLLEVFVTGPDDEHPRPRHTDVTRPPRVWVLSDQEKLALVVLGRRYLRHDPHPQPLTWRQTAAELAELQPGARWTEKRVEHTVNAVRIRLSRDGVPWLTREEVGEPVGNALNDHLIRALLTSTNLVPRDLRLIDAA